MLKLNKVEAQHSIRKLLKTLFPIHRTLVNSGFKESLEIIDKQLPLDISAFPSGKQVYDWVIPNAWDVKEAYITNREGKKIVDFKNNNLHISSYSKDLEGWVTHKELLKHLNYREDLRSAIPYNYLYYKDDWSFNVSYDQFLRDFNSDKYFVKIRANSYPDYLRIGEHFIQGQLDEEILITTYMCHPSMANDNLSGVVVAVELFKWLRQIPDLRYSYRLIIIPETIGAITYLAEHEERNMDVVGGFTVYCCGDSGNLHYKCTYSGKNLIDEAAKYAFTTFYSDVKFLDFWPGGSDERQFNGTGVRMPMGAITRTPAAEFKEYHTSLDTLELVKDEYLFDTLEKLIRLIKVFEADETYTNLYKGEPCFSRHNIKYPTFKDALIKSSAYNTKILANEIDGKSGLLKIAEKWNISIFVLQELADSFEKEGLIRKKSTKNG